MTTAKGAATARLASSGAMPVHREQHIESFERWATSGDPVIKARIIVYNQDNYRATRVLLDGISGWA